MVRLSDVLKRPVVCIENTTPTIQNIEFLNFNARAGETVCHLQCYRSKPMTFRGFQYEIEEPRKVDKDTSIYGSYCNVELCNFHWNEVTSFELKKADELTVLPVPRYNWLIVSEYILKNFDFDLSPDVQFLVVIFCQQIQIYQVDHGLPAQAPHGTGLGAAVDTAGAEGCLLDDV